MLDRGARNDEIEVALPATTPFDGRTNGGGPLYKRKRHREDGQTLGDYLEAFPVLLSTSRLFGAE